MKWIVAGLFMTGLISGCNAVSTEAQARSVCESVNASEASIDRGISLAQDDKAEGFSASESMDFFQGDCEDECEDDTQCLSDCMTCANAIVQFVYSSNP